MRRNSGTKPSIGPRRSSILLRLAAALFLLGLLLLQWGVTMRRGINHDEHQFIAAGALLARDGLLPYVDYPYFHLPLLAFIYAAIFRLGNELLLGARAFSVLCAWLLLGRIAWIGYHLAPGKRVGERATLGAAGALLLAFTPLFVYTSGRAWNHDPAALLSFLAASLLLYAVDRKHAGPGLWTPLFAGLLLGLAIITRSSFALLIPVFLIGWWLSAPTASLRRRLILWFGLGGLLGALPALWLFARAPEAFIFGNLTYVRLNTRYYLTQAAAYPGLSLAGKLRVGGELLITQPANALPLLLFGGFSIRAWPGASQSVRRQLLLLAGMALAAFIGALLATPAQTQYFYAPLPFVVLGAVYAAAALPRPRQRTGLWLMAGGAVLAVALTGAAYAPGLAVVLRPGEWTPHKVHVRGELAAGLVDGRGPVLTLTPTLPLEGGADIYSAFATGPFAARVAHLMDDAQREQMGVIDPVEAFDGGLGAAPRALLTGMDNDDAAEEAPLINAAREQSYLPVNLPDEGILWLSPLAEFDDALRLGATLLPSAPLQPGADGLATLYLQAVTPMEQDFNLLLRLIDNGGGEAWRADGWPYGAPTSAWPVDEVRAVGYTIALSPDTAPGLYQLEATLYDPVTLDPRGETVKAGVIAVAPLPAPGATTARLGDHITLHQTALTATESGVTVSLLWQSDARLPEGLIRFVQALDASGQVVAQADGPVMTGFLPSEQWPIRTPVAEEIALNLPPGSYTVIVGFYARATLARLPVYVNGQAAGDYVRLGALTVP
ncbi:MAG: glycosyltransferase family 39 protein [Caldilineaceae bacterium]|nr:glycosyltransferase family 39 protein [Caldilineaceae bacterium]